MADTIRVSARKGYTILHNELIVDKRLSLKTKGLMAVILSRPDGWEYSVSGLAAFCNCGKDAIRGALKELEAAGYLTRQQLHGPGGTFSGNLYEIHDTSLDSLPASPSSENPTTVEPPLSEKPSSEKPSSGNPTQRNKDLKKERPKEPPYTPQGGKRVPAMPKWKPERFINFWDYYREHGRGENRSAAVKAWDKLKPDDNLIDIMAHALTRQVKGKDWQRGIGIPYASTWLNNRRWEDEIKTPTSEPESSGTVVEKRGLKEW